MATIYLAAGCFWGAQRFLDAMCGVHETTVGFANGHTENPTYKEVYTDATGFAETVKVVFDPQVLPLEVLLRRYFSVIDPCSLNKQGEDEGTRYRTGIYYTDDADLSVIQSVYDSVSQEFTEPLAVEIEPLQNFYSAEEYHQKYLEKNPQGYCHLPIKARVYPRVLEQARGLLDGESDLVACLANTAALLHDTFKFWWTGFYLVKSNDGSAGIHTEAAGVTQSQILVLGPFQGLLACTRIPFGKGVCGTAWKNAASIVVPDVEEFPGHIACSSESRSEIVVPIFKGKAADEGAGASSREVVAVLDIDSRDLATFDRIDRQFLEEICQLLSEKF